MEARQTGREPLTSSDDPAPNDVTSLENMKSDASSYYLDIKESLVNPLAIEWGLPASVVNLGWQF